MFTCSWLLLFMGLKANLAMSWLRCWSISLNLLMRPSYVEKGLCNLTASLKETLQVYVLLLLVSTSWSIFTILHILRRDNNWKSCIIQTSTFQTPNLPMNYLGILLTFQITIVLSGWILRSFSEKLLGSSYAAMLMLTHKKGYRTLLDRKQNHFNFLFSLKHCFLSHIVHQNGK